VRRRLLGQAGRPRGCSTDHRCWESGWPAVPVLKPKQQPAFTADRGGRALVQLAADRAVEEELPVPCIYAQRA
jgi:hypothetical protein